MCSICLDDDAPELKDSADLGTTWYSDRFISMLSLQICGESWCTHFKAACCRLSGSWENMEKWRIQVAVTNRIYRYMVDTSHMWKQHDIEYFDEKGGNFGI